MRSVKLLITTILTLTGVVHPWLSAQAQEKVEKKKELEVEGVQVITWRIDQPNVTQAETAYGNIAFQPGDVVAVDAGGGVQTGGRGKTWKLYVDPRGPNSDRYYFGQIKLPGMPGLVRVSEFMRNTKSFTIPSETGKDLTLHLGYTDDDYTDNGYDKYDDRTDDQCKNMGAAWVEIMIVRKKPKP